MAQYEGGQIEFVILSLIRDPLLNLVPALAENVKSLVALSARLDIVKPDWLDFIESSADSHAVTSASLLSGADLHYGLESEELGRAKLPEKVVELSLSDAAPEIMAYRQQLITAQAELRISIKDEMQQNISDEERAAARSCDYGAMMQSFVRKVRARKQPKQA